MNTSTALFGCNTYSYMRSHSAGDCVAQLSALGFREFELMVHPGHLWPAELSSAQRRDLRRSIEGLGVELISLNMPNIDINIAGAAPEMRAYSLNLLTSTVQLAGDPRCSRCRDRSWQGQPAISSRTAGTDRTFPFGPRTPQPHCEVGWYVAVGGKYAVRVSARD